jgi:hypothetical protein
MMRFAWRSDIRKKAKIMVRTSSTLTYRFVSPIGFLCLTFLVYSFNESIQLMGRDLTAKSEIPN